MAMHIRGEFLSGSKSAAKRQTERAYCFVQHQYYHTRMKTITVKLHEAQDAQLERAAEAEQVSKSELIRRSLSEYLHRHAVPAALKKQPSLHDRLQRYIPKIGTGLRDLSTNPKYMEGYGRH